MDKATELSQWKEKARNWMRDNLTGLYNREFYDETIKKEVASAARYGQPLSVIVLDIDHFKEVNDRFGHRAGDLVLGKLGKLLNNNTRETDFACRYGGEEFVVVLPHTRLHDEHDEPNGAYGMADRLRKLVEQKIDVKGNPITVSAGVAQWQDDNTSDQLFEWADRAMLEAKRAGRNRVIVADQKSDLLPAESG